MPIDLKQNAFKYKDPTTGEYKSVDTLGEMMTFDAEAYTKGTKQGVPVSSGEHGYHDNAKYYKELTQSMYESIPQDYTELTQEVVNLKDDLSEKVDIAGENQVTPQNIQGMQFTKTTGEVEGENIFTSDMLFAEGKYVAAAQDNTIGWNNSASYNAYCIPVEQNTKYKFTESRFVVLATGNTFNSPTIGTTQSYLSEIETGEATYLFLSIDVDNISNIYVKPVTVDVVYSDFVLPDWLVDNLPNPTEDDLTSLENRMDDVESGKVDKDGTGQIKPQNISGVEISGGNILDEAERLYSTQRNASTPDGYVIVGNGEAIIQSTDSYCSFLIHVKPNTHYTANNSIRFVALFKNLSTSGSTLVTYSTAIGSALANVTSFDTGEADHVIVSFNYVAFPIESFVISEGNEAIAEQTIVLPDWMKTKGFAGKHYAAVEVASLNANGHLDIPSVRNNLRKGERIIISADIVRFAHARLSFAYTPSGISNFIDITDTYITVKNSDVDGYMAHGLTIADNFTLEFEYLDDNTARITLTSKGDSYTHIFVFVKQTVAYPTFYVFDGELTNVKMSWTCKDLCKNIWLFGDSYVGYATSRWPYYLKEQGYDNNILLDGFPGEGSVNGRASFNNLLNFGVPKFAVWCLGMNDGTDGESTPSENWATNKDLFLEYCNDSGVTPIFATIPSVPNISHEQKNAWVRSSGYRYIDFAKAVGATPAGAWISGMLASDNVHPTEQGAKALYARVLLDFPEIMIDGTN